MTETGLPIRNPKTEVRSIAAFFSWLALLLVLDQITKAYFRAYLAEGQFVPVIPGVFEFTLVYNEGIAFGLLQGAGVWLTPLAGLVAVVAAAGYARAAPGDRLFRTGMVLLAAGALGNLIDRLFNRGRVTDFIDIKIIHVFNVADMCITFAAALLVVHWVLQLRGDDGLRVAE